MRIAPLVLRQLCIALSLVLAGCSGGQPYAVSFMPPPAFLEAGEVRPFSDAQRVSAPADPRVFFATLREPSGEDDSDLFYTNRRATEVRLGVSRVALGRSDVTWDMARQMSILKNSTGKYPLVVAEVEEYGVLDRTVHPMFSAGSPDSTPRQRFAAAVNERLAITPNSDVFIYVHGYKVNFENPTLVAAELWHFLGYEGVFIPFSWPSRRGRLAYFGDTESARYSALYLREFIEFLATETNARRINILGYSAGTRLVAATLHQLALVNQNKSDEEVRQSLRLGDVILVGSDIDRGIFANYLLDGLLRMQERFTIYQSPSDKALGFALFVLGNERLGQLNPDELTPAARRFLVGSKALSLISVADAPGFDAGNGHSYFRDNPLVSSDVLATLRYELAPAARGLAQDPETGVWMFPQNYLANLQEAIFTADPELARRARAQPVATVPPQ